MSVISNSTRSRASLENLPAEVWGEIFSQPRISSHELKSLRLACRSLAIGAAPALFYRVRISCVIQDQEAFFNIADSKHLAFHVRMLIWDELGGNRNNLVALGKDLHTEDPYDLLAHELEQQMFDMIDDHDAAASWKTIDKLGAPYSEPITKFQWKFLNALWKMPKLHTFVSKPMDRSRRLQDLEQGYPFTAGMVLNFTQKEEQEFEYNCGFRKILVPTLRHLNLWRGPRIRRLLFADETSGLTTSLTLQTAEDSVAFSTLEHLDLSFGGLPVEDGDLQGFFHALAGAQELTSLRICQETGSYRPDYTETASPGAETTWCDMPTFPRLKELHLETMHLWDDDNAITDFIKRHGSTLRKLTIAGTEITKNAIVKLSRSNCLKLDSFVIVLIGNADEYENPPAMVTEKELLEFVNHRDNRETSFWRTSLEDLVFTHIGRFDVHLDAMTAWFDTRVIDPDRGYEIWEYEHMEEEGFRRRSGIAETDYMGEGRMHHPVNGLWYDADGVWYNPRTDAIVDSMEFQDYNTDSDVSIAHGSRVWDVSMGLWFDQDTKTLHKFAKDRDDSELMTSDRLEGDEEPINDSPRQNYQDSISSDEVEDSIDDTSMIGNEESVDIDDFDEDGNSSGENSDNGDLESLENSISNNEGISDKQLTPSEAHYTEEFNYLMMQHQAPRWHWYADHQDVTWYWENPAGGNPTEIWHFKHRNGEEAYGHDPLEYWSDWLGVTAGDVADPTPYGWRFKEFEVAPKMVRLFTVMREPTLPEYPNRISKKVQKIVDNLLLDTPIPEEFDDKTVAACLAATEWVRG